MTGSSDTTKTIAAAVLALVAAGLLFMSWNREPAMNLGPYEALGSVTADITDTQTGKPGEIVLVVNDPGDGKDPVLESQIRAFQKSLKAKGRLRVRGIERVVLDAQARMGTGGALTPDQLATFQTKYPNTEAMVFFIGFPPSTLPNSTGNRPRRIVASAALPGYRALLENGVIDVAIVPKHESVESTTPPRSLREIFDREYDVITKENADRLR